MCLFLIISIFVALSFAFAQSVKLDQFELDVSKVIEENDSLPKNLVMGF